MKFFKVKNLIQMYTKTHQIAPFLKNFPSKAQISKSQKNSWPPPKSWGRPCTCKGKGEGGVNFRRGRWCGKSQKGPTPKKKCATTVLRGLGGMLPRENFNTGAPYYISNAFQQGRQARVQGGAQGACPPPLEIEKQTKKRSSEQILSYFTYILLLF